MTPTITDIISRIKRDKADLGIMLYEGASMGDIVYFEKMMEVNFPDDIKTFYRFCNGFESNEDMFRLLPLDEMIENKNNGRNSYLVDPKDFHFAEYMIYCDMWTISINGQNGNEYFIYNKAETAVTLTNSFVEFLEVFLSGGVFKGLYEWKERIEASV